MTEKKIKRIENIRLLLIEHNKKSFKLDSENNILKIRKTSFIKNILYYLIPEKQIDILFFSKKKNKNVLISPKKLLTLVISKLPKSRGVHPFIFFLFHDHLINFGIEYIYFEGVDTFELRSNKMKIREQLQESFKIIEKLLSDPEFEFFPSIFNSLILNNGIKIEEKIKTGLNRVKHRFIDMTLQITKNSKVYLEINEHHHNKELDLERSIEIYIKNNTHPVMIYKEEIDSDEIVQNIWKEIAFGLFKDNPIEAMIIYLTKVNNFNLLLAKFFVEIQMKFIEKEKGIPLRTLKTFMADDLEFRNFYKFIENMINSNNLKEEKHFIIFDKVNIENCVLNKHGYDTILMLPREEDWKKSSDLKESFSDFKSNYLKLIQDLMSCQSDRIILLKDAVINYKRFSEFNSSAYHCLQGIVGNKINQINDKLDIKLHSKVWCLKYQKGERVPFYELEKLFSQNIVEYIKSNNETKQNILNYQMLNNQELESIIDLINSDDNNDIIDNKIDESLEETLTF